MSGKILIVDDDIDTLQLVGTMLERQGFQIVAANNGVKALEIAQNETPDLILLDVMMPGMDGYEVTRRLRMMDNTAFIPIVLFTAKAQVDDKVEGFEAGADDYLTKPTHPAELIARVKTILNRPKTGSLNLEDTAEHLKPGHVIGVLAAKGGLGVSTLAINLGISLHQRTDEYVIVAETRPGKGDIGFYLGYSESDGQLNLLKRPPQDINLKDVEDELIAHGSGILLMVSSAMPMDEDLSNSWEQLEAMAGHLSRLAPYTILDMGTGLTLSNRKLIPLCDEVIVVVDPRRQTLQKTQLLLDGLETLGADKDKIRPVLINRSRLEIVLPTAKVEEAVRIPLAGVFTPAPELAYQAAARHVAMINQQADSLTAQQFNKLADAFAREAEATPS